MADDHMTGATVACRRVPAADLARLLDGLADTEARWGLVWRLDRIAWLKGQGGRGWLYYATGPNQTHQAGPVTTADLLKDYPTGRMFDERSEWRWQPDGAKTFAVLGLAENPAAVAAGLQALSAGGEAITAERRDGWQVANATWRLTGSIVSERKGDPLARQTWFETRYPAPLVYPVARDSDHRGQPRLDVCTYADASGAVCFVRFCQVRLEVTNT